MIEPHAAFDGFGHPAVVIIALVLIVSRGLDEFRRGGNASPASSSRSDRLAFGSYRGHGGGRVRRCPRSSTMSRRWRLLMSLDIDAARQGQAGRFR
jgi:hypothetical protein